MDWLNEVERLFEYMEIIKKKTVRQIGFIKAEGYVELLHGGNKANIKNLTKEGVGARFLPPDYEHKYQDYKNGIGIVQAYIEDFSDCPCAMIL